jgi:hypothetical protein
MTNPQFLVNIAYVPMYRNGSVGVYATQSDGSSSLVSQSIVYSGGYFQASMPEIRIYATGSSYATALNNLMIIATASSTSDNGLRPLGQ